MPQHTDLNIPPYHDDYTEEKDYYKFLFQPGLGVQTRELISLQSMMQKQVERFGDAVFKRGTIVEGCNFVFTDSLPYAKLEDLEVDGTNIIPSTLVGMFAQNSQGLKAFVVAYQDGFEATDPDLKSIYLRYINSGTSGSSYQFSPSDTLTITDANTSLYRVRVDNGGLAFSNTDRLVVTSAVVVNVSTGTFTNGQYVHQDSVASNLQIVWIDDVSLALSGQVILGLRPKVGDLANATVNTSVWATVNAESIMNSGNTAAGLVEAVLGVGAQGGVVTDGSGRVLKVMLTDNGRGYANAPFVSIKSSNNSSGINALSLAGLNYRAKAIVAANATAVGNGYSFGVTDGVIYQRGFFLRVAAQSVLVSKYDQIPDNVVAGFNSVEDIVDANEDTSLNDPLVGDSFNAPGANRLRIVPELKIADKDDIVPADDFFPIVEWNEGQPVKINQVSAYSQIGDEMARRSNELAGDFVVDRFNLTTRSPANSALEGTKMDAIVDPGLAYVSGYRVETTRNQAISIDKGIDHLIANTRSVDLSYGSYVRVKELGGNFQFSTGDLVSLRSAAKTYLTSYASSITPPGVEIGTARVRSLIYESGIPGTPSAVYRLYLFAVTMGIGKNFRAVQSVYYAGTNPGIADTVLELDGTTSANIAVLKDSASSWLLFPSGSQSLKNANNATYVYRTNYQAATVANSGLMTRSLASNPNEFFIRSGVLTDDQAQDMVVVPLANLRFNSALSGTISVNTTTANAVGTTSAFITEVQAGDWIYLSGNATENTVRRVVSVVNNTMMILDSNGVYTNTAASGRRTYPMNTPMPFGNRAGLTANVDSNGNIMTLNFGGAFQGSTSVNVAFSYDVLRMAADPATKTAARDRLVRINLANNVGGTTGPWCLGIPDAFRLKAVYVGTDSSVSNTNTNAVDDFLIDSNQNPDYLDLSWLNKRPASGLNLTSANWLLVQFDHFVASGSGYMATPSYVSANSAQVAQVDALALANLTTTISSYEIPEVYASAGKVYDLVSQLDFRPTVVNTAVSTTTQASSNINPVSSISFGNTADPNNDKKFPNPGAAFTFVSDQYLGRNDSVIIGQDGNISILRGVPAADVNKRYIPQKPNGAMLLDVLAVPPYPTLPANYSNTLAEILTTRLINERGDAARVADRTSGPALSNSQLNSSQPARITQQEIGSIQRRVAALEYYTSLNLLETDVKDRVIPSSVTPGVNRFKFGFFVDGYDDDSLLETSNPQYSANVESGRLVPQKMSISVMQDPGQFQYPPYVDFEIVDQNYATGGSVNTCVTNTVSSNTLLLVKNPDDRKGTRYVSTTFDVLHTETIHMADESGAVTLYFDNHNAADRLEVYRGNVLFKTVADSVTLTAAEKTMLKGNTFSQWFKDFPGKDRVLITGDYYTGTGKITWTHNPALGKDYTVLVGKGQGSWLWRYALQYPVSTTTISCSPDPTPGPVQPVFYRGVMVVTPVTTNWNLGGLSIKYVTAHRVVVTGMKPNTLHSLVVEGQTVTGQMIVNGQLLDIPTQLITDSQGKLDFTVNLKPFIGILIRTYKYEMIAPNSYATGSVTSGSLISSSNTREFGHGSGRNF